MQCNSQKGMVTRGRGSATLEAARARFACWRRKRRRGERIPEALWSLAVEVSRELGPELVSQELGVHLDRLRARVAAAATATATPSSRRTAVAEAPRFLEVEVPLSFVGGGPECLVEYEDGRGGRLRIELRGAATAHLGVLAQTLRGSAP